LHNGDKCNYKYEMSAFANTHQETGDPSIKIPYPWLYSKHTDTRDEPEYDFGGMLAIMKGVVRQLRHMRKIR
jgi:hypothetical protein